MFLMWYGIALGAIALAAGLQREDEGKRKKWVITVAWSERLGTMLRTLLVLITFDMISCEISHNI